MKKIFLSITLLLCLGFTNTVKAQDSFTIAYSIAFPTGDLGNYIDKTSYRGAVLEYQSFVKPNIGVGFSLGMNTFYEKKNHDTYTNGTVSLSGTQWRYSNHVPIYLTANYYFKPNSNISPFAGLGIGTIYSRRNTDMYIYTVEEKAWNFGLQPTVGVLFATKDFATIHVSAKYNYGFESGNELKGNQSYVSLNLGFTFE